MAGDQDAEWAKRAGNFLRKGTNNIANVNNIHDDL
jgi:hypothetical protein